MRAIGKTSFYTIYSTSVLASFLLLFQLCVAQDTTVHDIVQALQILIDGQAQIIDKLEGHGWRTEMQIRELQSKLEEMTVPKNRGKSKTEVSKGRAKPKTNGQQRRESSSEQCSCANQVLELQDLLALNECDRGFHNCSEYAICVDLMIGFRCSCLPGYSGDGYTCEEINECESGEHNCHSKAICSNTDGGFTCRCPEPFYTGDGYNCEGPFCESPGLQTRFLGCVTTGRGRKNWTHAQAYCKDIGGRLLQDFSPSIFEEFRQHFGYFEGQWVGIRGGKWSQSGRPVDPNLFASSQNEEECGFVRTIKTTFLDDPFEIEGSACSSHLRFLCQLL